MDEEKYNIRKDQIQDEQGNVHIVYGVEVPSEGISIPDIFFDEQKKIHREFKKLGNTLMALENVNVIHSDDLLPDCEHMKGLAETMADSRHLVGTLPNRVSVGEFKDAYGNQYLMVLNRDYETDAAITLDLKDSSRIYEVYIKYVSKEDIHVYSIDEVFMDISDYLHHSGRYFFYMYCMYHYHSHSPMHV